MAEYIRRPVSKTIESGFSVNRRASSSEFEIVRNQLAHAAVGYTGIDLRFRSDALPKNGRKAEFRSVKNNQIRARAGRLGHLSRASVYTAIKKIPSTRESLRVTANLKELDYSERAPRGNRVIAVEFDPDSEAKLRDENQEIGASLAELAGLPLEALNWPQHDPDLVLAYISQDTPAIAHATMRGILEEYGDFSLTLNHVRLLPSLDSRL